MKLGCWSDEASRALDDLEPDLGSTHGNYRARANPISVCFLEANKRGLNIFALQDKGQCFVSDDFTSYKKYGESTACEQSGPNKGKGGPMANEVYEIIGTFQVQYNTHCKRSMKNEQVT